jgi:hypothetical protein
MNKAFVFILFWISVNPLFAQRDNSFKIIASVTGLGASYEFNPATVIYVEGGLTSSFTVARANVQSKIALVNKENFKLKFGVEGAYIAGNLNVGNFYIDYDQFSRLLFMPLITFESRIVGIQIPLYVDRDFKRFFPMVGITLNVSKDQPAERIKKDNSRKEAKEEEKERERKLKELEKNRERYFPNQDQQPRKPE